MDSCPKCGAPGWFAVKVIYGHEYLYFIHADKRSRPRWHYVGKSKKKRSLLSIIFGLK